MSIFQEFNFFKKRGDKDLDSRDWAKKEQERIDYEKKAEMNEKLESAEEAEFEVVETNLPLNVLKERWLSTSAEVNRGHFKSDEEKRLAQERAKKVKIEYEEAMEKHEEAGKEKETSEKIYGGS